MSGDGTVGKAMDVLEQVAGYARPVRFNMLLQDSPFPKATLYRFLQTLTRQRLLEYHPEHQTYSLGVRLVRLAHTAWTRFSIAPLAQSHIEALSAEIGLTVHLAQLDHAQVLYVDKRNARRPVEMYSAAGKVGPAYCTGVGKAMLAHLPDTLRADLLAQQSYHPFTDTTYRDAAALDKELQAIRARGFAYDREEHEPGIICVAVAILSARGAVIGGLSVTGSTRDTDLARLEAHIPALQRTAAAIARDVADWHFPSGAAQTHDETTHHIRTGS